MNAKVIAILVSVIAVGAIVWATGALNTPPTSPSIPAKAAIYTENINSTSTAFQNSTQVTVDLLNNGNGTATLTSYYVTDSSGNEYALTNWSGPSIAPNSVTTTTFSISSSCSQCTLHGSAFTFTSGYYTIRVMTGRGNVFTFGVNQTSGRHYSIVLVVGFGDVAH